MPVTFPKAKINIGLYITAKRTDGYHDICSCFYPIPLCDVLELVPDSQLSIHTRGLSIPLKQAEDNLCIKAFSLLKQQHNIPENVAIYLHKIIPMGAGLGGGSSDAAATLVLANTLFSLGLDQQQLKQYASRLGSDCAFFIDPKPSLCTGRGEQCQPVPLSLYGYHLLVVYPQLHIATAEAYKHITPRHIDFDLAKFLTAHPPEAWSAVVENQFEAYVFRLYPALKQLKSQLYEAGACYASMSGSGSAFYGIFKAPPPQLPWQYPSWQFRILEDA